MPDKLSQKNFLALLEWLDPEPDNAGKQYEKIRRSLIAVFLARGFSNAEDLVDMTFDRVASRIDELSKSYEGEKIKYFVKVARFIQVEQYKNKEVQSFEELTIEGIDLHAFKGIDNDSSDVFTDQQLECLNKCLNKLKSKDRQLILDYYNTSGAQSKINDHKILAKKNSFTLNALRIQIFRIKKNLFGCFNRCIEK